MALDLEYEKRFIAAVDTFEPSVQDLSAMLEQLEQWRVSLSQDLELHKMKAAQLNPSSALAQQIQVTHSAIDDRIGSWAGQWESLKPAQAFAETFDDKLILLVYGKFNAGKSSFCNFFATRFKAYALPVQYFRLDEGQIQLSDHAFKEGVTETTSQLQGVILGNKLVLVDTPGLHSATQENSDLTKRFTDSADGVLWLSSSASPGQVQELDELGRELNRRKPLLPVLTRSDFIEEDEVDGEIVKILRNKTVDNRQLQEQDVESRAQDKLIQMGVAVEQLKTPLSISVRAAQAQQSIPAALTAAGFERLYEALLELIAPVIAYKKRKSVEMLLHHLEENVIGGLRTEVLPQLQALVALLNTAVAELPQKETQIARAVWRHVIPLVPALLDEHEASSNVAAVYSELQQQLLASVEQQIEQQLADYVIALDIQAISLPIAEKAVYEQVVVEQVVVGVSHDALYAAIEEAVQALITEQAQQLCEQGELILQARLDEAKAIEVLLLARTEQLNHFKPDRCVHEP